MAGHDPDFLDAVRDRCEETHAALEPLRLFNAIRCPLLLLRGDPESGGLLSDEEVQFVRSLAPDVRAELLTGVGHRLHLESPQRVARVLDEFIRDLDERRSENAR